MAETPPGMQRLRYLASILPVARDVDAKPENFIARIEDLLEEAAADGAILVEVRFGNEAVLRPNFMGLFREAERRVQTRYPQIRAEAIFTFLLGRFDRLELLLQACIQAADEGLGGMARI